MEDWEVKDLQTQAASDTEPRGSAETPRDLPDEVSGLVRCHFCGSSCRAPSEPAPTEAQTVMQPNKEPLQPDRLRTLPSEGWSWIDRRFLKEKAHAIHRDAVLLYFFLAAVSDKNGVSYWSDPSISACLRLSEEAVANARDELESQDLLAYQRPLYQVLSIPSAKVARKASEPTLLADIFRQVARQVSTDTAPGESGGRPR